MNKHSSHYLSAILAVLVGLAFLTSINVVLAQSDNANPRAFAKGYPLQAQHLPASVLRDQLLALDPKARGKAMKTLRELLFTSLDLPFIKVDANGDVYFADYFPFEDNPDLEDPILPPVGDIIVESEIFLLHSRPGAPNVIYLDFDGHTFSGTAWSADDDDPETPLPPSTYYAKAYDISNDDTIVQTCSLPGTLPVVTVNFSSAELARIGEIWHRTAEDYAPFNVDVTTQEPSSFNSNTGRILYTDDLDYCNQQMPSYGAGGVAYVGVFGNYNYHTYFSPALVYNSGTIGAAEAGSHEMGHNLSLGHDGTSSAVYYSGHGANNDLTSWAPIMGSGYSKNVTQWSNGNYTGHFLRYYYADAGCCYQVDDDDLAAISGTLGYRSDDHGDDIAGATALLVQATGTISVTNPENDPHDMSPANKGVIHDRNDLDYFWFDAGAGDVEITIEPAWAAFYQPTYNRGANLDVAATLYDSTGSVVTSDAPTTDTDAYLSATVSAGRYYIAIDGEGKAAVTGNEGYDDYASLGMYFISGTIQPATEDTDPPTPNPMTWQTVPTAVNGTSITMTATTASDLTPVQYYFECTTTGCADSGWQTSSTYIATGLSPSTTYTYVVRARDFFDNTTSDSSAKSATTNQDWPTSSFTYYCDLLICSFTDASTDSDGTIDGWAWDFDDSSSSSVKSPVHAFAAAGTYQVSLTVTDDDGATDNSSESVVIVDASTTVSVDAQISASADDVEEFQSSSLGFQGFVWHNSVDIDLTYDTSNSYGDMVVGLRFNNVDIPQGAVITNTDISFVAAGSNSGSSNLLFRAEDSDNASAFIFNTTNYNVTTRPMTSASVAWSNMPAWSYGQTYTSPELKSLVQEVVDRPGWVANNSMIFAISGTSGQIRRALSYDASPASAPTLHVEYTPAAAPCTADRSIMADIWESFSLPCDPGTANKVQDIFSGLVSGGFVYNTDWFVWRYDVALHTYFKMSLTDELKAGEGYWIYTTESTTINYVGTENQRGDIDLSSTAIAGRLNYIGNTENQSKPWKNVQVANGGSLVDIPGADPWFDAPSNTATACEQAAPGTDCLVSRAAYVWKDGSFHTYKAEVPGMDGNVDAGYSVFVRSFQPGTVLRLGTAPVAASAPAVGAAESSNADDKKDKDKKTDGAWVINLMAESGPLKDVTNALGQQSNSREGKDSYDIEELPPFGNRFISLTFENENLPEPEWGYTSDYRALSKKAGGDWNILIRASADAEEITISWSDDISQFKKARLLNIQTGKSVKVKEGGRYTFTNNGDDNRFTLTLK